MFLTQVWAVMSQSVHVVRDWLITAPGGVHEVKKIRIVMNKLMTEILNLPGTIVEEIQEIENTLI